MVISPLSFCEFFEIHGSKFKPYPIRDLGEAAVGGITHSVFFFRIRKDPFNGFFALLVKVGILGSVSCVIGKLLVIFPNMPLYDLYAIFGMCAKMSCRAVLTCFGIALVFSVSVSVGRTVCKRMVISPAFQFFKIISCLRCHLEKLEVVNIILHFYMKSQYDLVQIILMQ